MTTETPAPTAEPSDQECMRDLALRKPDALKMLYSRYAPLVFHIASQSLDSGTAEDIVQEVFLALWQKADRFDPRRGGVRPWLLQIAHFRILNELRTRSRRPKLDPNADDGILAELPDPDGEPSEAAWKSYRERAVREAVNRLPPAQRQALSLAFFEELSHEQVAAALKLPLGTVKTRIRAAAQKLRFMLTPLGVAALALALLVAVGARYGVERMIAARTGRALTLVTSSDITSIHIPPAPGIAPQTHGSYRGRPGTPLAVLALHNFAQAPAGKDYQAWVLRRGQWTSMGTVKPDRSGTATLVAEGAPFAELPEAVEVTLEPKGGSAAPTGPAMIEWHAK